MIRWTKTLFILVNLLLVSLNLAAIEINDNCHEHEKACFELAIDNNSPNLKVAETTKTNNEKNHSHENCLNCHHTSCCSLRNAHLSSNEFKFTSPILETQKAISTYKIHYSDADSERPFWPPKA